jgi:hypothetical protein
MLTARGHLHSRSLLLRSSRRFYHLPVTSPPTILFSHIKLEQALVGGDYRALIHNDPLDMTSRVYWTNKNVSHITVKSTAEWKTKLPGRPKYVSKERAKTAIGIVSTSVRLEFRRGRLFYRKSSRLAGELCSLAWHPRACCSLSFIMVRPRLLRLILIIGLDQNDWNIRVQTLTPSRWKKGSRAGVGLHCKQK